MHIAAWSTLASVTFCRQLQAHCCACLTQIENFGGGCPNQARVARKLILRRNAKGGASQRERRMASNRIPWLRWPFIVPSARTGVATLASLLVARLFRLPEAYWAPITTIVITQSSLGAAWEVSWQRFVGTLVGAVLGGI